MVDITRNDLIALVEHYCQCCDDPQTEWQYQCPSDLCWVWKLRQKFLIHIEPKKDYSLEGRR